jgi:hypothetical protein
MNYAEKEERYINLIQQFLKFEINSETFCDTFFKLRREDRKIYDAKIESWSERYDLQLIEALKQEKITKEEFSQKWAELWGYKDYVYFEEMLDQIFTSCDCYTPVPSLAWEISGEQLLSEIRKLHDAYQTSKETSNV